MLRASIYNKFKNTVKYFSVTDIRKQLFCSGGKGGEKGFTQKRNEGNFRHDENIPYLNVDGGYTGVYNCQNWSKCTIIMYGFYYI